MWMTAAARAPAALARRVDHLRDFLHRATWTVSLNEIVEGVPDGPKTTTFGREKLSGDLDFRVRFVGNSL
jgi:hypothetical protein